MRNYNQDSSHMNMYENSEKTIRSYIPSDTDNDDADAIPKNRDFVNSIKYNWNNSDGVEGTGKFNCKNNILIEDVINSHDQNMDNSQHRDNTECYKDCYKDYYDQTECYKDCYDQNMDNSQHRDNTECYKDCYDQNMDNSQYRNDSIHCLDKTECYDQNVNNIENLTDNRREIDNKDYLNSKKSNVINDGLDRINDLYNNNLDISNDLNIAHNNYSDQDVMTNIKKRLLEIENDIIKFIDVDEIRSVKVKARRVLNRRHFLTNKETRIKKPTEIDYDSII